MSSLTQIQCFLGFKRIAMVGVSRNPKDFSRSLFQEFRDRHYDVMPVNPETQMVDGVPCFARVQDISPPVEGALLLTNPAVTMQAVRDCDDAAIRHVWMYRGAGHGSVSPGAVLFCESRAISLIAGECPMMFLPGTGAIHRLHGFCRKLFGPSLAVRGRSR